MNRRLLLLGTVITFLPGQGRAALEATPPAAPLPGITLLTLDQLPDGFDMIMDGERTLDDVVANFPDPESAAAQFEEWGWQRNVVRAFHVRDDAGLPPAAIDGIYISVHELDSPTAAADALDFTFAAHIAGTDLEEIETEDLGDYARTIYGALPYGNEVTYYVQSGVLLIRFSASSPEGDPRAEARDLLESMLPGE